MAQSYKTDLLESHGLALPQAGVYHYRKVHSNLGRSAFPISSGRDTRAFARDDCVLFHLFCKSVCLLLEREMRLEMALKARREPKPVVGTEEEEPVPAHLRD